ncbi:hypothetical protein GCM10023258_05640 [Terrabacter aeriphilus]|uniref:Spectinomycin phosphotransferase n=1 Tax=Terrabacter aeriphilus TaxID=515662 RepID=A0ABP9J2K4_9MICO
MTPPPGLDPGRIVTALRDRWGIDVVTLTYAAVGFGGHHWRAVDAAGVPWFVTLDVDVPGGPLRAALGSARALADAGLAFVVAPVPSRDGEVVVDLGTTGWLSVTPWLDVTRTPEPGVQDRGDRDAVVSALARLHARTDVVAGTAGRDDLCVPERDRLERAMTGTLPWAGGPSADRPYADRAARALAAAAAVLRPALEEWDAAAARARQDAATDGDAWAVTHGEPHWRNVLVGADGLHLVDWDTTLVAPRARDLWHVAGADGAASLEVLDAYARHAGRVVRPEELQAQALRWDLTDVALYVRWFSEPHADDADSATAWQGLTEALDSLGARGSRGTGEPAAP